jgi:chromate transport protein ChrA
MQEKVKLTTLFFSFFKLGLTAYGGPAMVAYIRNLAVEKNGLIMKPFKKVLLSYKLFLEQLPYKLQVSLVLLQEEF